MFDKIKQDLFTVHGIVTTLIHMCFVVGVVTCWVAYQTKVLGNDPVAAAKKQEVEKQSEKTKNK